MRRCAAFITGIAAAFVSAGAFAHALNLFVHEEGSAVKGSVYFTGGVPAKNVDVQLKDAGGNVVGTTKTDADGNFVYTGTRPAGPLTFVVSTPDGHRAESKLEGATGPSSATDAVSTDRSPTPAPSGASSERQLGAIQEAIDHLEKRLWLRDVIGGIGYIFGLAGFWALWKSRQGRAGH